MADYHNHPLHHVYRKRIRGIRTRWLGGGFALGVLAGIAFTLVVSAVVVTQIPAVLQSFSDEPDVTVTIGEKFLNREATDRLAKGPPIGVANITLKAVNINLQSDNRMDLQPTFSADVGFTKLQVSPAVKNQLTVQDGKLAINMVGDPQLGDLNVPLGLLPFDLNGRLREAVNKVNNDLLISEINKSLESSFGGGEFEVEGVTTSEVALTVRMKRKT